jgi:hypothetical protein
MNQRLIERSQSWKSYTLHTVTWQAPAVQLWREHKVFKEVRTRSLLGTLHQIESRNVLIQ